jgi:hypothetical protein
LRSYWQTLAKDISHHLAKAAFPARAIVVIFTLIIVAITPNNLTSSQWSTGLTAMGTLLGVYGVWLTLEIFRIGDKLSQQQGKVIEEVHRSVMTGLKIQHSHELRRKFEEAKELEDEQKRSYWHFIWRFETLDFMGLSLKPEGYTRIRVIGINNPPLETRIEQLELPIYTVEVLEVLQQNELKRGRAYCCCINGKAFISNEADELDLHSPVFEFSINGIGAITAGSTGPRPKNYKRLKDINDPSSGDREQG